MNLLLQIVAFTAVVAGGPDSPPAAEYRLPEARIIDSIGDETAEGRKAEELGRVVAEVEVAPRKGLVVTREADCTVHVLGAASPSGPAVPLTRLEGRDPCLIGKSMLLARVDVHPDQGLSALIVVYLINTGGMRFEDTRTFLRSCVLERERVVGECRDVEIARTDIARYRNENPAAKWLYFGIDSSEAARISEARVLVRDADADGYDDLVVWRKECRSASLAEVADERAGMEGKVECDLDFVLQKSELLVMKFDPKARQFGEPRPAEQLPAPDSKLWRTLPGLNRVYIP
jgi:hypothetical protein